MKRSVKAIIAVCLVSVFAFALCGCAGNSYTPSKKSPTIDQAALVKEGTLTVGMNTSNAPFAGQQDGKIVGVDVDVAAALADEMGLSLQIVDVGSSPNDAIKKGTVDVVMGIQKTDTSVDAWLSDAYLSTATALFSVDENAGLPSTKKATTIAAQNNSVSANEVVDQFGGDYLSSTEDLQSAFSNLEGGKVKYAASDAVIGSYIVHQSNYKAKIVGLLEKPTGYCIAVSSTNTALKTDVSNALANISDQGMINVIAEKWLGTTLDLSATPLTSGAKSAKATSKGSSSKKSSAKEDAAGAGSSKVSNVGANAATIE